MWRAVLLLSACSIRTADFHGADATSHDAAPSTETVEVPAGDLTGPITWQAGKTYVLHGPVFVILGTLTIEPGTTIRGDKGSALVITRNARIEAAGTAEAPIVFTSSTLPSQPGDWVGLIVLGNSSVNTPSGTGVLEGFDPALVERLRYGGNESIRECGELRYLRIEYAGALLGSNTEIGGLTLAGCIMSIVDHVQVHRSRDDGVLLLGGYAVLRHLVLTQSLDDGLDWDLGWAGTIQFLVAQQRPGVGDKAIEADNNPDDPDATPRSQAIVYNATLVGSNGAASDPQGGIQLRRGSAGLLFNMIVMGFPQFGFDIDSTLASDFGGGVFVAAYFIKATAASAVWPSGFDGPPPAGSDGFDEAARIIATQTSFIDVPVDLADPYAVITPNWKPTLGSPVLSCPAPANMGFDPTATFCGAIGTEDWTAGWTRYPE